jgi:hypothetical protein
MEQVLNCYAFCLNSGVYKYAIGWAEYWILQKYQTVCEDAREICFFELSKTKT